MSDAKPGERMSAEARFASHGLFICLLVGPSQAALAQQDVVDVQYRRKAEMLYSLASLIQPQDGFAAGEETVVIGVLGKDPFSGLDESRRAVNHLDAEVQRSNANRTKSGRKPIVVRRFASARDYTTCHILFVAAEATAGSEEKTVEDRLRAALKKIEGSPVLIVGDTKGLAAKGAVVNFYVARDAQGVPKVAFEFNPDAARRAGLTKVDAGVYRLAKIVRDGEEEGKRASS